MAGHVHDGDRFRAIHAAFCSGDVDALRRAVGDEDLIPNGWLGPAVGHCLVYAIFHSPLPFIRELIDRGADPNIAVDDGFPPLIAALGMAQPIGGGHVRDDVDQLVRLLLDHGADPNQRGINDETALHLAVATGNALAVQRLLEAGADPELRTRIDDCVTPLEMVGERGTVVRAMLERRGRSEGVRLRSGLVREFDIPGDGDEIRRQEVWRARLRMWSDRDRRQPVRWSADTLATTNAVLDEDGTLLTTDLHITRGALIAGVFYGVQGMRVGGTRRLSITPHLGYAERGIPGAVPPGAHLTVEVTVLGPPS